MANDIDRLSVDYQPRQQPEAKGRQPTPQQQALYDAVRDGTEHLVGEALAGTGKTTTAVGCLAQGVRGKAGFVAFNRHIAEELKSRLPPHVRSCTLHSLGFAAVRRAFPDVQLDETKLARHSRQHGQHLSVLDRQSAERLCQLAKYTLATEGHGYPSEGAYAELADHYGVELPEDAGPVFDLATTLLKLSADRTATVDFDDMVWLPVQLRLRPEQFDLLLVDEAQDLNRCQQRLALAAAGGGRLCPVGDRHQAIYGFSGADCDAIPRLAGELALTPRRCRTLPLTVTFRCPTSHVALARRIVPALEAAPGAIDGVIRTTGLKEVAASVQPGDLVVGRKNAPLVSLTYKLVLAGVRATMRGRDIGRGLLSLIARLKPDDVPDLIRRLERYRQQEEARLIERDAAASAFQSLEDRCDCLGQLASQAESLDALERFIASVFDDSAKPGAAVVLSSVHRAKGLEADRVYVLDPASLPLTFRDQRAWEAVQERNLCYVAATRAKRELVFEDFVPRIFGDVPCTDATSGTTEPKSSM
jgi:DNA helicase-2/ATP-dependent DNA helicase PcrA